MLLKSVEILPFKVCSAIDSCFILISKTNLTVPFSTRNRPDAWMLKYVEILQQKKKDHKTLLSASFSYFCSLFDSLNLIVVLFC